MHHLARAGTGTGYRLGVVAAGLLSLAMLAGPAAGAPPQASPAQGPQSMLLGILVAGSEVAVTDVWYDGREYLIPLDAFLGFCECELNSRPGYEEISTPLGSVVLAPEDISSLEGRRHLRQATLETKLAIGVSYDPSALALRLDIPWYGMSRRNSMSATASIVPDVRAPVTTLSGATLRFGHTRIGDQGHTLGNAILFGRAAGGTWRLRYDDDFEGRHRLAEYGWTRQFDDKLLLLGHQRLSLHPLLGGLQLTGLQGAWTNRPLDLFARGHATGELLPRRLRSTATIRGVGIPAGTAVLRVDDRNVATQLMGLDGLYEFSEVTLYSSQSNRIEVLIFDRQDPRVPVGIHDHSRNASRYALPGGSFVMLGGIGAAGNALDPGSALGGGDAVGFYQARYGVTDGLTFEGAVQRRAGRTEAMVGAIAQLGRHVVAGFSGAIANGRRAYLLDFQSNPGGWRLLGRSQMRQAGFSGPLGERVIEHHAEASHRFGDGILELGVVGRYRRGLGSDVAFVRPMVTLRPSHRLLLRARPDYDGSYRVDASWSPSGAWRMGVSRGAGFTRLDISHKLGRRWRSSLVAERSDSGRHREAVLVTWFGDGRWNPSVSVGPLFTNSRPGAFVGLQAQVLPGVLVAVQYETASALASLEDAQDHRIVLNLSTNLAFAGSRVVAGHTAGLRLATGGIAGNIRTPEGYDAPSGILEGLTVRVNGRPATRTGRGGKYHMPRLTPGVYRIDFDPDRLPIELTAPRRALWVEVAAGAVSRADFDLGVEFGIAGRVRIGGAPAPGILLELLDDDGERLALVETDRFGLYRLDGVVPGRYTLRLADENAAGAGGAWPSRAMVVTDDFLFEQDLSIETGPAR